MQRGKEDGGRAEREEGRIWVEPYVPDPER